MKHRILNRMGQMRRLSGHQKGAFTMFSAVLILILLTEMIIYAVQTGVFEQRKSANEMRQKHAFHLADSAIEFGKEFMLANSILVPSPKIDKLPDGTDGWLSADGLRWLPCSAEDLSAGKGEHPCYAEPADNDTDFPANLRDNMYYYSFGTTDAAGNAKELIDLPIDVSGIVADAATEQVRMHALLCMLDIDRNLDPIIQGCTTDPAKQDPRYFMVTLMARGEADCNGGTCSATALIADKIGSFGPGGNDGGPAVPLTTRSNFPPTGTAEIVPNPNGGGVGVPISAWMNANPDCENQAIVDAEEGSWATCERHEWYGVDRMPNDFKCPGNTPCSCDASEKRLSYADGNTGVQGIDLVPDPDFPCDLFYYIFGVNKDADGIDFVKFALAKQVLSDCDSLDENSFGVYWITGPTCNVAANTQVGSPEAPVFLISAARTTRFNGGASLFGMLFVTDAEEPNATFYAVGSMTIYGAAVVDATLGQYQGTFQIVYVDNILEQAVQTGGFGAVAGAWADFHQDWR